MRVDVASPLHVLAHAPFHSGPQIREAYAIGQRVSRGGPTVQQPYALRPLLPRAAPPAGQADDVDAALLEPTLAIFVVFFSQRSLCPARRAGRLATTPGERASKQETLVVIDNTLTLRALPSGNPLVEQGFSVSVGVSVGSQVLSHCAGPEEYTLHSLKKLGRTIGSKAA